MSLSRPLALLASGGLAATALVTGTAPAYAAFPGSNGRIAFEQEGAIYSVDAQGDHRTQLTTGSTSHGPRYSPDGRTLAFSRAGDIWTMRADGSNQQRVTSGDAGDINPAWSPDGQRIVFSRATSGAGRSLYVVPVAGGAPAPLTSASDGCAVEPTWTADGRFVVFWDQCTGGANHNAVKKVRVSTGQLSTVVGAGGVGPASDRAHFVDTRPAVTPDGRHVVFLASQDSTGEYGIALTDLSGGGFRWLYLTDPLYILGDPAVSPDGTAVVFSAGNENPQLRSACIKAGCTVNVFYESGVGDYPRRPDWQAR